MAPESGKGTEYVPFRKRFPALTRWQDVDLSSPDVRRSLQPGQEPLLWRALEGGCRNLGDLLDHSEASVLRWRSVGVGKAARISDMLRTLESQLGELARTQALGGDSVPAAATSTEPDAHLERLVRRLAFDFDFDAAPGAALTDEGDSEVDGAVEVLCAWAATVGGAGSRADALTRALNASSVPVDVANALDVLGDAAVEPDPFSNLETVLLELGLDDPRSRSILFDRITAPDPLGLQALGDKHRVTRERIRQLETKVRDSIVAAYPQASAMRVVRWLGHALREELGAFAPVEAAQGIAPHIDPQLLRLAIYLEGYGFSDGHIVAKVFELPEEHELDVEAGVVDLSDLAFQLVSRGVREQFVDAAIASLPGFEWVGELLVTRSRNFVDRAVIVINQHGEPMDVEELRQRAAPSASCRGFRQRVFEDERFVRTSRNDVALAAWGYEEYRTVSEAMSSAVQAGPWELDDLADDLAERFGVSPNSVRMYAYAPVFRVRDGMLELRPSDDPYVPRDSLASVQGLFGDPGDGRFRWNVVVDKDLLRGSGRAAPSELATAVGLMPGGRTVLVCEDLAIGLTWPVTSHTGPRIGSLKSVAESLECELGDYLNLSVSCLEKTMLATKIRPDEVAQRGRFQTMTGVDPGDLGGLRQVLDCQDGEIAVLVKRGDGQLADVVVQTMHRP